MKYLWAVSLEVSCWIIVEFFCAVAFAVAAVQGDPVALLMEWFLYKHLGKAETLTGGT